MSKIKYIKFIFINSFLLFLIILNSSIDSLANDEIINLETRKKELEFSGNPIFVMLGRLALETKNPPIILHIYWFRIAAESNHIKTVLGAQLFSG